MTLLLGGTRSGKSRFAEQTAIETEDNVIYIAIAIACDQEMQACIDRHRHKVEGPIGLAAAISDHVAPGHCLLMDCLTLYIIISVLLEL